MRTRGRMRARSGASERLSQQRSHARIAYACMDMRAGDEDVLGSMESHVPVERAGCSGCMELQLVG